MDLCNSSCFDSWICCQIFLCLKRQADESKKSIYTVYTYCICQMAQLFHLYVKRLITVTVKKNSYMYFNHQYCYNVFFLLPTATKTFIVWKALHSQSIIYQFIQRSFYKNIQLGLNHLRLFSFFVLTYSILNKPPMVSIIVNYQCTLCWWQKFTACSVWWIMLLTIFSSTLIHGKTIRTLNDVQCIIQ